MIKIQTLIDNSENQKIAITADGTDAVIPNILYQGNLYDIPEPFRAMNCEPAWAVMRQMYMLNLESEEPSDE